MVDKMQPTSIASTLVLLATLVSGDKTSSTQTSNPSPTTRIVTVGKTEHQFVPNEIKASAGDIISFQFFPPNHSVVRAEWGQPCIPYEYTGENKMGFDSGFYPLDKVLDNPPSWNLTINDTNPIFFYCAAPGSCNNWTMVGAINPNSSEPLSIQRQNAGQSTFALAPGEPFPEEGTPDGDKGPASNSKESSSSSPSGTAGSPSKEKEESGSPALSGGAIAGIVIACLFIVGILGALFFVLGRQRSMLQILSQRRSKENLYPPPAHPSSPTPPPGGMAQYYAPWETKFPERYQEQSYVPPAPPYRSASSVNRGGSVEPHGSPAELPSPGNGMGPGVGLDGHPALREQYHHSRSRTASSTFDPSPHLGFVRGGSNSKSSAILGTDYHGSGGGGGRSTKGPQQQSRPKHQRPSRSDRGLGREGDTGEKDVNIDISPIAPSPPTSPRFRESKGDWLPPLRPLSWWTKKRERREGGQKGFDDPESPTLGQFPSADDIRQAQNRYRSDSRSTNGRRTEEQA